MSNSFLIGIKLLIKIKWSLCFQFIMSLLWKSERHWFTIHWFHCFVSLLGTRQEWHPEQALSWEERWQMEEKSFCFLKPQHCFCGGLLHAPQVTQCIGHGVRGEGRGTPLDGNSQSQSEEKLLVFPGLGCTLALMACVHFGNSVEQTH